MSKLNRRQFGLMLGAGAATLSSPYIARAHPNAHVVVIGGGAGGATAARYIAKEGGNKLDVTLIDPAQTFTTCFFSNLYIGGFRSFNSISHGYDVLQSKYGIKKATARAVGFGRNRRYIRMSDGSDVFFDKLVVSPGIDLKYDTVAGYSEADVEIAPHAWKAGWQTALLKAKLDSLENGENVIMVAPPNPYRCPPGPYERVSMMAHILKAKGNKDSKIIIIDPKPKFSKQALFLEGWEKHYSGMVEWYSPDVHGGIKSVNAAAGTVETALDTFKGGLLNVIPGQKAGGIADELGLSNDSGFCPINPETMGSTKNDRVHVIGDASIAGAMPKSGFSANSQAKVAANSVVASMIEGKRKFPARYSNTCWSLIDTNDGIKVGAQYAPKEGKIAATSKFVSQTGEDAMTRKATYEESVGWYSGITKDMFG